MGRKNLLDLANEHAAHDSSAGTPEDARKPGPTTAVNSLRDSMRDLGLNGVQDLDAHQIETDGPQDRLTVNDPELAQLAESIKTYGQQVPVLVRPIPGQLNRYIIVYGRRRLAAIRSIDPKIKVKALIRNVDEREAIIAQGQENNQRLDPSHIEKALFAFELRRLGYDNRVIQDALSIDRFACSKMLRLAEIVPKDLIEKIGAAHDIGRRPWTAFAELVVKLGKPGAKAASDALSKCPENTSSSDRFNIALQSLRKILVSDDGATSANSVVRGPQSRLLGLPGPAPQVSLTISRKSLSLTLNIDDGPDFAQWLAAQAEGVIRELQDRWVREKTEEA
ncbi:plasmid partitioning protein RepB [Pseudogemmobacter bohemicus]|uniref:plasmid partitioning protein RepB n=1 Tax=Pseudogemmobacter bohemicus TaxID=2250708 RepID=UPI000DD4AA99|nr:plasmid partitioning protein RepB [Pseudogemmobacter bohemicus]